METTADSDTLGRLVRGNPKPRTRAKNQNITALHLAIIQSGAEVILTMYEIHITFGETVKSQSLRTVEKDASETFGGFTVIRGQGGWVNDDNNLVEETSKTLIVRGKSEDLEDTNLTPEGWARVSSKHLKSDSNEDVIMWDVRKIQSGGTV